MWFYVAIVINGGYAFVFSLFLKWALGITIANPFGLWSILLNFLSGLLLFYGSRMAVTIPEHELHEDAESWMSPVSFLLYVFFMYIFCAPVIIAAL